MSLLSHSFFCVHFISVFIIFLICFPLRSVFFHCGVIRFVSPVAHVGIPPSGGSRKLAGRMDGFPYKENNLSDSLVKFLIYSTSIISVRSRWSSDSI